MRPNDSATKSNRVMLGQGDEYPWLVPGDVVELTLESVGTLRHRTVAGQAVPRLR